MIEPFSVFSSNVVLLDNSVYQLWLLGRTVDQAVTYRRQHLHPQHQSSRTSISNGGGRVDGGGGEGGGSKASPASSRARLSSTPSTITAAKFALASISGSPATSSNPKYQQENQQQTQEERQQPSSAPSVSSALGATSEPTVAPGIVRNYVLTQYRTFELLEHYLHNPTYLAGQFLLPMSPEMKTWLVERYYHFDQSVMRELLGRKMNSRSRKDLDEVCEKTKVPIGSCKRQFDNLKRIMKRVEDTEGRSIAEDIQDKFMLSREQANQYAHIIFINENRLDTSHKRLRTYSFIDFEYCAAALKKHWTLPSTPAAQEFDTQFSQDIRELKPILLNSRDALDDFKNLVLSHYMKVLSSSQRETYGAAATPTTGSPFSLNESSSVTPVIPSPPSLSSSAAATSPPLPDMEHIQQTAEKLTAFFKPLLRNLLNLGASLSNTKEAREVFVAMVEKIAEPCLSVGLGPVELDAVMEALIAKFPMLDTIGSHVQKRYTHSFLRLIRGMRGPAARFMKRHPNFIKRSFGSHTASAGAISLGGKTVSDVV